MIRSSRPAAPFVRIVLPLILLLALLYGCGGGGQPSRAARVHAQLAHFAYLFSHTHPPPSPGRAKKGAFASEERQPAVLRHPPPGVPGEGGRLVATYRAVMRGGDWLTPVGHPGAGGTAVLRLYGHSEVCWLFTGLHGIYRKLNAGIFFGQVARHPTRERTGWLIFASGFQAHGCATAISRKLIDPVEHHPGQYFVGIDDTYYAPAIGGQL